MSVTDLPQLASRVGTVLIDWGTLQVIRDDATVRITPKAAAVLHLLVTQCDTTVSRRSIFNAVWPGSASADEVLTQVINELRRAFVDSARDARYIATIPKLGYRWTGPAPESVTAGVAPVAAPSPTPAAHTRAVSSLRAPSPLLVLVTALAIGLAIALLVSPWSRFLSTRTTASNALGVAAVRPLTAEPGLDLDPAISRDGKRLAYIHIRAGRAELRVRTIGADAFSIVPLPQDGTHSSPAWSPDGSELALVWRLASRCEIRRVDVDGSDLRTLDQDCPAAIASSLDWSADGSYLAFSRFDRTADALGRRDVAIYRIAPDGTGLKRLSHSQRWLSVDLHPRISADSRDIAFVRDADGRHRVVSLSLGGVPAEREVAADLWPYRVAWGAAPGTLLVAGHGRSPAEIQRIDLGSGNATMLVAESAGPGLALSPDGNRLVFERRSIDDNVWSVPSSDLRAPPQRLTNETRSQLCPRISRDGSQLAYLSDEGGNLEVVVRQLATSARTRISAFAPEVPVDLAWSPHGGFIAVILGTMQGRRLAVLTADGRRVELPPTVRGLDVTLLDWSHDEDWLYVVVATRGRQELHRLRFPDFGIDELVTDRSVGALSASRNEAGVYLAQPRSGQLEWLAAHAAIPVDVPVFLKAIPADQWLVQEGTLVQMRQVERGSDASLLLTELASGGVTSTLAIQAPDPPLGRNFDLGGGRLWYANRDTDESDLVEMDTSRQP